jgi:exopolyphosphatase/pppGpp-phosphohydrolase
VLYPTVAALYKDLKRLKRAEDDRYVTANKSVLFLYGLPVYRMILQKVGLSELRLCGYPLRYGAFLVWHAQQMGWDNRPRVSSRQNG